jgi:hypothetical protein
VLERLPGRFLAGAALLLLLAPVGCRPDDTGAGNRATATDDQSFGPREEQTALQGTTLRFYPQPDLARCQADCAAESSCRAVNWIQAGTYDPADPAMCYLLSGVTGRTAAPGHVAVVKGGASAGPAGGGAGGWGVWASAAGGQWSDPCAIQYVAAEVSGNRYDGNPAYRRVRTRATQPEADLDIDHFGRYHRDQPDGVVKLTSCDSDDGDGGTGGGGGSGGVDPQWMLGRFQTDLGEMTLVAGGGRYRHEGVEGTLTFTRVDGATVEGTFSQPSGGVICKDGTRRGTFVITFNPNGFRGLRKHCEGEAYDNLNGFRP